jgi:hypothetical protein
MKLELLESEPTQILPKIPNWLSSLVQKVSVFAELNTCSLKEIDGQWFSE